MAVSNIVEVSKASDQLERQFFFFFCNYCIYILS